jgi:hypothetical protein
MGDRLFKVLSAEDWVLRFGMDRAKSLFTSQSSVLVTQSCVQPIA